jgi:hypothetical protein
MKKIKILIIDEKQKYVLKFKKDDINKEKDLLTIYSNNYNEYILEIDNIVTNIDSKKNIDEQNKKDIQIILNNEFTKLIELSERIEDIDRKFNYNTTENKIYLSVEQDNIFKNWSKLKNLNTNTNTKLLEEINEYFTEQKFIFIDEINKIYEILKENNEIKPFFKEYMNHFVILSSKINNLLDQINLDIIIFKIEKIENSTPYSNIIKNKLEIIKKIKTNSTNNINNKGEFTTILPYTDSMFLYFIYLTLMIDYLTFFYE